MGTYVNLLKPFEKKVRKEGITITVSGMSGTGKSSFARKVAEVTGLKYVSSGEIFREIARERGIPLEEFSKSREKEVDLMIDRRTLELAQEGGYVLDGRLTGVVAGDFADERVFVMAKKDLIAKRVAERDGKSDETAREDLQRRDRADKAKYMEIYGVDPEKTKYYTLVVGNNGSYEGLLERAESFGKSWRRKS